MWIPTRVWEITARQVLRNPYDVLRTGYNASQRHISGSHSIDDKMKNKPYPYISIIFVILFVLIFAQPVSAHGNEPRLEINPERLNPGAVLDIRGVDFDFEEEITLTLVSPQTEIPFGTVLADAEGVFLLSITLPVDVPEGTYVVWGTTDDHKVESPPITVSGAAIVEGGEGERSEDDLLLAPMQTYAPGFSSTPLPEAAAVESPPSEAEGSNPYLLWTIAGVGVILVVAYIRMKKR